MTRRIQFKNSNLPGHKIQTETILINDGVPICQSNTKPLTFFFFFHLSAQSNSNSLSLFCRWSEGLVEVNSLGQGLHLWQKVNQDLNQAG